MRFAQILAAMAAMGMLSFASAEGPAPKAQGVRGKIVKIEDKNITVLTQEQGKEAKEVAVQTDDKTVVVIDGKAAKFEDLKVGLGIYATPAEGVAKRINAWKMKHIIPAGKKVAYAGTVVKVEGTDLTIHTTVEGKASDLTLKTDDNTEVMIDGKESPVSDLKAGNRLTAQTVNGVAFKVIAFTHR